MYCMVILKRSPQFVELLLAFNNQAEMISTKLLSRSSFLGSARALQMNSVVHNKNSVDPKEVDHFTQLGDEWLNSNGPMKPLYSMNDLRIPFVRDGLINTKKISEEKARSPKYLSGIKILDVGCGGGILSLPLARLGADVTGLDPTPKLIEIAKINAESNLPGGKLHFLGGTIEEHSATHSEKYDAIVCSEVIEHVPVKDGFINACVAATKPGGSLFFTTISQSTIAWVFAIVMAEYVLRLLPTGTHEYDKFITSKDLSSYLQKASCNVLTINGMMYNPLTNKWSWCPSDTVNYGLHAIKRYK